MKLSSGRIDAEPSRGSDVESRDSRSFGNSPTVPSVLSEESASSSGSSDMNKLDESSRSLAFEGENAQARVTKATAHSDNAKRMTDVAYLVSEIHTKHREIEVKRKEKGGRRRSNERQSANKNRRTKITMSQEKEKQSFSADESTSTPAFKVTPSRSGTLEHKPRQNRCSLHRSVLPISQMPLDNCT